MAEKEAEEKIEEPEIMKGETEEIGDTEESILKDLDEEDADEILKEAGAEFLKMASGNDEDADEDSVDLKERLVRQVAENENLRKRFAREQEELSKYAITNFARDLINVAENLHMAAMTIPEDEKENNPLFKNIATGVEMTLSEMTNTLKRYGIERFAPEAGDEFDHNKHQAMSQVESDEIDEGKIAVVMQAGYTMHDRLLRPALVNTAKKP